MPGMAPGGPGIGTPGGMPNGAPQVAPPPQKPEKEIPMGHSTYTPQPEQANILFGLGKNPKKLKPAEWVSLSNDLYNGINAAISARGAFEQNLQEWSDSYDLLMPSIDNPQFQGSNIRLPYSATQVEALKAYIAGMVLVPRMYIVTGRTPQAAETAYDVERFYNSELVKMRPDGSSYFQNYSRLIHLGIRDGVAVAEVLWNRTRKRTNIIREVPSLDEMGNQAYDKNGKPAFEKQITPVDVFPKNYADVTPVPIKDFLLIPAEAPSVEAAAAVAKVEWLYEDQLNRMVEAGILDGEEVERALNYVPLGNNEIASDRQGYYDKDASYQLDIGLGQGTQTSKFFKNRGPIKVWRIHSREYDMSGDGVVEENVFWLHELSQRMLGWMPYDYPTEGRPFFSYTPFPRPDEFYGYSLIERLAKVQTEMDVQHNARIDDIVRKMNAPLAMKTGTKIDLHKGTWYGNEVHEVEFEGGNPVLKVIDMPDIPVASFQEEALLQQYGDAYSALNQPAVGAQSSGRRSATEMRQQTQSSGTRMALICNQLRITLAQIINFIHTLNKTYLTEDVTINQSSPEGNQIFKLPLDVLMRDYEIGIAGATEPLDSITRRNETIAFVQTMMSFPMVQADMGKQWYLARLLAEAYGRVDTIQIIGSQQDAKQLQQQQQQQQAMQQMMHGGQPGQKPPGGGGMPGGRG
jgi:hypothetical protein